MRDLIHLFNLQFKILKNTFKFGTKTERIRTFFLLFTGIVFSIGSYMVSYQVVIYISTLPVIGSVFTLRILALAFLTSFIMLIFSSLTTAFSTMYDNEDIQFLFSLPINDFNIFSFKYILTSFYSSWMVVVIIIPLILSFAIIKNFTFFKFIILFAAVISLIFISTSLGVILSCFFSYLFPSKKIKNIVLVFLIIFSAILYSVFRISKPEELLSPDRFSELVEYLNFMEKPVAKWLPSWWVTEVFKGLFTNNNSIVILNLIKIFSLLIVLFFIILTIGKKIFYNSLFYKRQKKLIKQVSVCKSHTQFYKIKPLFITIFQKELRMLFREPMQWVQLVIVVALTIIYLFNISRLPIDFEYVRISISFFNLGGVMFILTAIVLRFVFVQPTLEYKTFWLLKAAPLNILKVFLIKLLIYLPIVLIPGVLIVSISNIILSVNATIFVFGIIVSVISSFVLTISGYSLGVLFPKKDYKDIAQIETSFGGLMFLILSLCYIVFLLSSVAEPIKRYVLGQRIYKFEIFFYTILFLAINFIYAFGSSYYALKKFLKEY